MDEVDQVLNSHINVMTTDQLPQLLVTRPPPLVFIQHEKEFCDRFDVVKAYESPLPTSAFLQNHAQSVKAVLSFMVPVNADLLRHLPSLELVVSVSTGVDRIDLLECSRRGVSVANAGDVFSEDTADAAVGLCIDVLQDISAGDRSIRRGLWPVVGYNRLNSTLKSRRVGIVGLGNIGSKVARRLEAFGCSIAYTSRKKKQSIPYQFFSSAQELASNCNVLIICCSLTDHETSRMISKDVLTALGKHGIIINVGRGAIVDEKELVRCLVSGEIGGAGLDVFENEPNVPEELLSLDNVVITPHRSGFTSEAFFNSANLEAFFSNKPLLSPVRAK